MILYASLLSPLVWLKYGSQPSNEPLQAGANLLISVLISINISVKVKRDEKSSNYHRW